MSKETPGGLELGEDTLQLRLVVVRRRRRRFYDYVTIATSMMIKSVVATISLLALPSFLASALSYPSIFSCPLELLSVLAAAHLSHTSSTSTSSAYIALPRAGTGSSVSLFSPFQGAQSASSAPPAASTQ
eukprot:267621-Hanusia_phi.AAC.1